MMERADYWHGWRNTASFLILASCNTVDMAAVWLQPTFSLSRCPQAHLLVCSTHALFLLFSLPRMSISLPITVC